ncbi:MAG: metalloprotease, partial [Bacteroidota bacterium]
FKSQLENPFANDWIVTTNASTNIWRWIEAYGDLGYIRNKGENARFVYDSGIRLNLVTDYFELYFPVYSNNGWEIADRDYGDRIRFVVTISPKTLIGLFTRKWF